MTEAARSSTRHVPVLLNETLSSLQPAPGQELLDGTVGGGGHAEALLRGSAPDGRLLALDRDPAALERAGRRLAPFGARVTLHQASFAQLATASKATGHGPYDGILLDLGFSSDQIDDPARGIAFRFEGPLDMRLDPEGDKTAADLVNHLDEQELADVIFRFGEERRSRRIAKAIVAARPVRTTTELGEVIAASVGTRGGSERLHPATRTFQALRIAVNDELGELERGLPEALAWLKPGGRMVVISFHSLEDRIVKRFMHRAASGCRCPRELPVCVCDPQPTARLPHRRPQRPSEAEVRRNPRARSARLRVAEKLSDATVAKGTR